MKIIGYDHETRHMSAPPTLDECVIEKFYDRSIRLWTVLLKDKCDNQVAPAMYSATRGEAARIKKSDFEFYY